MKSFILCFLLLTSSFLLFSQTTTPLNTVKVFVDCSNGGECYPEFIRQEIPIVDFVRDRLYADVHVIVTTLYNSSGAGQYSLNFVGRNNFSMLHDTLQYNIPPSAIDNDKRNLFVSHLKLGLIPFLTQTEQSEQIIISFKEKQAVKTDEQLKDKWNYWVFSLSANGSMNGSQNYFSGGGYFNVSADRETETQKSNLYMSSSQEIQKYRDDGTTYKYDYHNYYIGLNHYQKMTNHWGLGAEVNGKNSLYSNYEFQIGGTGNVEYSVFPYKEFNTKRWIAVYSLGPVYNQYYDTTIYLKTKELNFVQNVGSIFSYIQPWGSTHIGVFWSNYLADFKKNNLSLNGALQFKITKGLNFAVWGNYTFVHDQINIRKGDIDLNQLLVRNKELLSSYDYNLGVGISYRFGSKFNNAVNPIFRGLNYNISL